MASNEELFNAIQRYLNGEMDPEELKKFQEAMVADQSLAEEVQLHADMQALLQDSPENLLRSNLQKLNDQAKDSSSSDKSSKLWNFLWLLPVLLVAIGWGIFNTLKAKDSNEQKTVEQSIEAPVEESAQVPAETDLLPEKNKINDPSSAVEPKDVAPSQTAPDKEDSPPIALNFEPTPALEFLIGNNVRANDLSIEVVKQQEDVKLTSRTEPMDFQFVAQITSSENLLEKTFKLHLFNNNPEAFGNFEPIQSIDLQLVKETDSSTTYTIKTQKKIQLQPGLYYQVLEDFEAERIHWAGKFIVTE
jgi:hypothetical protein